MKISIIIPIYNSSLLVERTIKSVVAQNGDFTIEIIAVDDCSTDDSCRVIEAFRDERIILKRQIENKGPAAARNVGINLATGKYLAFLDADDYWKPDFLIKTVAFLEKHPECEAVSVGQIHRILGKPDAIAPTICQRAGGISEHVLENFWQFWVEHNHICTGSVLIRTDTAKQTGGQREDLRIFEDWEYWGLLSTYGKWGFISDVLFVSDGGAVTKKQGWIRKNKVRWENTPKLEDWSKRLIQKEINLTSNKWYNHFSQNLACMLSYNLILAGYYRKSYDNIFQCNLDRPDNKIGILLKHASSQGYYYWLVTSVFLRYTQYLRHLIRAI